VTDHNGLYGAMEFAQAAKAAGIQPITGAEITLTDGSHLTLLAESSTGYANLCRLITSAFRGDLDAPHEPCKYPVGAAVSGRPRANQTEGHRGPPLPQNHQGCKRSHDQGNRLNPQLNPDLLPEHA